MYHSSIGTSGTLAPGTRVFLTGFITFAHMLALSGGQDLRQIQCLQPHSLTLLASADMY